MSTRKQKKTAQYLYTPKRDICAGRPERTLHPPGVAGSMVLGTSPASIRVKEQRTVTQRPNVLIVTTDQQRTDSLSCYGAEHTHTPHLDRLAAEGVLLERAYCTNPVCTPARASIFSGLYLSRHGAWNVGMNVPEDVPFVSHRLAEAGYRTHYVGKAHFQSFGGTAELSRECVREGQDRYPDWTGPYYGFQTVELSLGHGPYGLRGHYGAWVRSQVTAEQYEAFQEADSLSDVHFGGQAQDWDLPVRLHSSVWTADRTIEFLQQHDPARPFLLAVGFQDPHHPHCVPRDFADRVDPQVVPLPDFTEGELDDKPPHFLCTHRGELETSEFRGEYSVGGQGRGADFRKASEQDARLGRAYYYSMVRLIDQQMGRILEAMERHALAENTLVVFTTDHGELLGDHGLWMKGPYHYEQLVRIPMIVRWPQGFARGLRVGSLLSQVDIVPTILAAAGVAGREELDGVDAGEMLRGDLDAVREDVLIECVDDPEKLRLKTVVTAERKLTWYAGQPWGELYDLAADPAEKINRWDDPAYAADKARLLARILDQTEPLERRTARHSYA